MNGEITSRIGMCMVDSLGKYLLPQVHFLNHRTKVEAIFLTSFDSSFMLYIYGGGEGGGLVVNPPTIMSFAHSLL